ncbi:TPA: DUF4878 domain-containing protein [Escherichia coli]|uniref:DUF4878 domain-containing protein n=2 Tax=Escherichia coli TaxID=562 RepID=UPI001C406238|nr:DUF4878 domain-containing protein [Escherichia coli]HEA0475241.1 DUF4878 domain-containing protein [Escherichia coli]
MKKRLLGLFSLFFICLALVGCGKPSPGSVAVDFYRAVADGNVDKAWSMLYIKEDADNELEIKGKLQMIVASSSAKTKEKGGVENIIIKSTETDSAKKNAIVVLEITFNNDMKSVERVKLKKQDDVWKVSM